MRSTLPSSPGSDRGRGRAMVSAHPLIPNWTSQLSVAADTWRLLQRFYLRHPDLTALYIGHVAEEVTPYLHASACRS